MSDTLLITYANLPLKSTHYRYVHSDDDVALSVIRGDALLGGMKESVAKEYYSLGLRILAYSDFVPGFTLVINTQTVTQEQIEMIKQALLDLPKSPYRTGRAFISHGVHAFSQEDFFVREHQELDEIPTKGNF